MTGLLGKLFGRGRKSGAGQAAYDALMAQALAPAPYAAGIVPDTRDGRFHMVTLHAALVMKTLSDKGGPDGAALSEQIYAHIFSGFDYALREEGTGDSSIARKIRKLGEEFYGLGGALIDALTGRSEEAPADVLSRNGVCLTGEAQLAAYLTKNYNSLQAQTPEDLLAGKYAFVAFA